MEMKTQLTATRRIRWVAGTVAVFASLLTIGGPVVLAEHYAQAGTSHNPSGYYARRNVCPDNGKTSTAVVSARRSAENFRAGLAA
jgi:hypothetical protein